MSFEPLDYVRHVLGEVAYVVHASAGLDDSAFFAGATFLVVDEVTGPSGFP